VRGSLYIPGFVSRKDPGIGEMNGILALGLIGTLRLIGLVLELGERAPRAVRSG